MFSWRHGEWNEDLGESGQAGPHTSRKNPPRRTSRVGQPGDFLLLTF
jgi:hypothetical protein